MTEQELSVGTLKVFEALEYLRKTVNALTQEIVILTDERDEYKRKWKELQNDKALPTPNR